MPKASPASFDLRLHQAALIAVVIGVPVSLLAATILWFTQGVVATTMLAGTLFATIAAYPVWRAYQRKAQQAEPVPASSQA